MPPLIAEPDVVGAFAANFVNPYAAGYSTDVLLCWVALAVWVVHEASAYGVRHGWVCLLVGVAASPWASVPISCCAAIRCSKRRFGVTDAREQRAQRGVLASGPEQPRWAVLCGSEPPSASSDPTKCRSSTTGQTRPGATRRRTGMRLATRSAWCWKA